MKEQKSKSIGALWMKTSKAGNDYFSGKFGEQEIVVFKNNYKEKENQPDFLIYPSEKREEQQVSDPSVDDVRF